jgi:hypothetical protein
VPTVSLRGFIVNGGHAFAFALPPSLFELRRTGRATADALPTLRAVIARSVSDDAMAASDAIPDANVKQPRGQASAFSRREFALELLRASPSKLKEGAGNAGCPMHPQPRVRFGVVSMHTSIHSGGTGNIRHSPRNGSTAYIALSPGTGLSCPRHP